MKEAILNAMNPIEKKILEKEVQKIHIPEEPIPFDDFGKKIRYVKKIRELLDQDAELKEIKLLFGRKGLHQGWYYKNETPLASYVYWYGRGCGREDVCLWALEYNDRRTSSGTGTVPHGRNCKTICLRG